MHSQQLSFSWALDVDILLTGEKWLLPSPRLVESTSVTMYIFMYHKAFMLYRKVLEPSYPNKIVVYIVNQRYLITITNLV